MEASFQGEHSTGAFMEYMKCPLCGNQGAYFTSSMFTNSELFDEGMEGDVTYTFVCANQDCAHEWKES